MKRLLTEIQGDFILCKIGQIVGPSCCNRRIGPSGGD